MKSPWRNLISRTTIVVSIFVAQPAHSQEPAAIVKSVTFYIDGKTGQVFMRPGANRTPLRLSGDLDTDTITRQIERKVEQKTDEKVRAAMAQARAQQDQALASKVSAMEPAWHNYLDNFQHKFRLGALAYLDYAYYTHTGYGPYFLENLHTPGVGNNGYNSFDVNRTYLNAYFTPTDDVTFRLTPELYRATGTASAEKLGTTTAVGSNLSGDLNLRVKYAYLQYTALFPDNPHLRGGSVTFGAQQNPLIPWEEDFGQYRFVYLSPWNFVGLSSSQIGLQFAGPLKSAGGEAVYAEYAFGAFDNGNFNNAEQANTKQAMARMTLYPFGAHWRYDGLGFTGFYDYGYGNVAPDSNSLPTPLKGSDAHFERIAAIVHYAAEQWNLLGEFDYGDNAFSLANLYRGSGPADAFAIPTGAPFANSAHFGNRCSQATPCYDVVGTYGPQVAAYQSFLNNGRSRQMGFDLLGHYHIADTKLTAFGMFQWFMPNDNLPENPLDFQRFVAGISYQFNEYVRVALDSQNLLFYHRNFGLPVNKLTPFNYQPGSKLNGQVLPGNPKQAASMNTVVPNLVPRDTHALFLNLEFAY
jgi:hypothetical protein